MAKFYKCRYCGNVIEKHHAGIGEIECCGLGMEELIPNTVDASGEKHIPVVEVKDGENNKLVSQIKIKLEKGKSIEQIAEELEETVESIEKLISSMEK